MNSEEKWSSYLGEASKKKNVFFSSEKLRKGGGGVSPNPKFSYQKKLRFFWNFFFERGGVPPIPKGCYHKKWGYWDIFAKKGALTQSIGMLSKKKLRIFRNFSPKGGVGGGLAHFKISLSEKTGASELLEGGEVSEFQSFPEKNTFFYWCLPLRGKTKSWHIEVWDINCFV